MQELTLTQGAFTDAELVARSRHGDDTAFEILAERHRAALRRALRALDGSPDLVVVALDAAHAALRRQAGPTQGVRPFLLLVLRDLVLRDGGRPCPVRPGAVQPFVDHVAPPHTELAAEVAALPDRLQALLWHRYVDQDPDVVVGAHLGLAPSEIEPLAWSTVCGLRAALVARRRRDPALPTPCLAYLLRLERGRALAVPPVIRSHASTCSACAELVADLDAVEQNLGGVLAGHLLGDAAGSYLGVTTGVVAAG